MRNCSFFSGFKNPELDSYEDAINNGEDEKYLLEVLDSKIEKVTTVHAKKKVITNHSKP